MYCRLWRLKMRLQPCSRSPVTGSLWGQWDGYTDRKWGYSQLQQPDSNKTVSYWIFYRAWTSSLYRTTPQIVRPLRCRHCTPFHHFQYVSWGDTMVVDCFYTILVVYWKVGWEKGAFSMPPTRSIFDNEFVRKIRTILGAGMGYISYFWRGGTQYAPKK